jgi:hypothetical protein
MAIPTNPFKRGTINMSKSSKGASGFDVTDVVFVTEQIKRMTDWQLTQLASALTEDHLTDKLLPKLEVTLRERENPLTRIDMPNEE